MSTSPNDSHDEDLVPVKLPSGGQFYVYGREKRYFDDRVKRYLTDNLFTNVADLQDLDRIIVNELLAWRWGLWLTQQKDYWDDPVDEKDLARQLKDIDGQLKNLKTGLGIDKVTRDKVKGEDSVSRYIDNLKFRAKEFGVTREAQLGAALELFHELIGKVTLYENCDAEERREQKAELVDIYAWLKEEAFPKFLDIDEHFRQNSQKFWIQEM